jgi:TonB-linked SusC/RagA family outer membrane protein
MGKLRQLLVILLVGVLAPSLAAAQQRGVIAGMVTGERSQPLQGALVQIQGTELRAATGAAGSFRIPNVPAGAHTVSVTLLGYNARSQTANVTAGGTAEVSFALTPTALALDELVVTGTAGETSRREQPAVISSVNVADLAERGVVTSVKDALTARVPGVSVTQSSGSAGTSQQIRIRGAASIQLSNEPLVFIDGVRADSRTREAFGGIGGQGISRLFDIDPNDIESIEVVKGPAAATLYGADAGSGVIQIITKKGRTGSNRFNQNVSLEYNSIAHNFTPPANYGRCTAALVAATSTSTLCRGQAVGTVVTDNPLVREDAFRTGQLRSIGYSARGGGENYGYFGSLNYDNEEGTLQNNELDRRSGRLNFTFVPTSKLAIESGFSFYRVFNQLPNSDNNVYGAMGVSLLGSPLTVGGPNNGFFAPFRNIAAVNAIRNELTTLRYNPTLQVNYTPFSWFTNRFTVGGDISRGSALVFFPRNDIGQYQGNTNTGFVRENRNNYDIYTLDYLGNIKASFGNEDMFTSDLSFGTQVINERIDAITASGTGLTTNAARTVSSAAQISASQAFEQTKSVGFLAQEQIGFRDRLFLQVGGRIDRNSSFGGDAQTFFLPKVGASWVVSDESFWQGISGVVPTLRLRAAFGTTGRSPTAGAALETYDPNPFALATGSASGVTARNPGNQILRPERGSELEAGLEAGFFSDRLGVELTYFDRKTTDLLVRRPLAPSTGFSENPFVNLGESVNRGLEYSVRANILNRENFQWDVRLAGTSLHNELISLGEIEGTPILPFGTLNRFTPGQQLGAFFTRRIKSVDVANNRAVVSDTIEFKGNILPTREGNVGSTLTLFRNLQLTGQMDWKGGFYIYNNTLQFRERSLNNAFRGVNRADATLVDPEDRIRRFGPFFDSKGVAVSATNVNEEYIEKGDFVRFRELSATLTLPDRVASRFGAQGASLTLGGQNLKLWSDYSGFDPEVLAQSVTSTGSAQFQREDFFTIPTPRRFIAKVNLQF